MLEHKDTSLELLQTELSWYHTCKLNYTLAMQLCVSDQVSSRRVVRIRKYRTDTSQWRLDRELTGMVAGEVKAITRA